MHMRNATFAALTAAILAVAATTAAAAPDGLYSADELMDADVYLANRPEQIGEVEDLILDSSLTVGAFVVETDDVLGLGGRSYIVSVEDVRVATVTQAAGDDPEYRVTLDATLERMKAYPEYSESWWDSVRARAGAIWVQTREAAESAWSQIKEATDDLLN